MITFKQCSVGVLDTGDDPEMQFDEQGRSHYFTEYKQAEKEYVLVGKEGEEVLHRLAKTINKDGQNKQYDCIMGLSGGVDSTYVALVAKKLGLRPLAVHLDNGWNAELSIQNVQNIVEKLDIDLHTEVLNWAEFKDLQRSYLKASVVDIEVVTDHAIFATLYKLAGKYGIKHILSGTNIVTEQVMPPRWIFNKTDHINIQAIHRQFGTVPLSTYPFMDLKVKKWYQMIRGIKSHSILNYVPYNKADVKRIIGEELDWRDYGGKHYESIFTRFYQGYILPTKFGIDKRKAHLSNLIYAGQISKDEAVSELEMSPLDSTIVDQDLPFVIKKLGFTIEEFNTIMATPRVAHSTFSTEQSVYKQYPIFRPVRGLVNLTKKIVR